MIILGINAYHGDVSASPAVASSWTFLTSDIGPMA
jgi:hypothetical protein